MTDTIIFIDDEEMILYCYETYFVDEVRSGKIKLETYISGTDFFEAIKRKSAQELASVKLIFLDINMPVMSGFEVLQILGDKHPDIPIIMISAYEDEKTLEKTKKLGAKEFLGKPIKLEQINQLVTKYCSQM